MIGRKAVLALVTAGVLAGCGTHHEAGKAAPPPPSRSSSAPVTHHPTGKPVVVTLTTGISNKQVRLAVGQQLQVKSGTGVHAGTGPNFGPQPCDQGGGGVLRPICLPGNVHGYTAQHPGTENLVFSIRPVCGAGKMCPQWVRTVRLSVTVTS